MTSTAGSRDPIQPGPDDRAATPPTQVRVRWSDLDPLGHVTAAVFFTYLEEGRDAWLHEIVGPLFRTDRYVVARVELNYRGEIPMGTPYVETAHSVADVGRSSITVDEHLFHPGGQLVADGRVVLVMWDPERHRSRPLSPVEAQAFGAAGRSG